MTHLPEGDLCSNAALAVQLVGAACAFGWRTIVWDLQEVGAWLEQRRSSPIRHARPLDVDLRRTRPVREDGFQVSDAKGGLAIV